MKALQNFNVWLFGYGSPATLAILRILIGTGTFLNLGTAALGFNDWFSEKGFVPTSVGKVFLSGVPRFSLLPFPVPDWVAAVFVGLVLLAAIMTALGLFTRLATIALALGVITLHHRNPMILHSGDTLMRLLVVYLAVSECGAAYSLDLKRKRITAFKDIPLFPQRLVQFQIALVYSATFWHKMYGDFWRNGTATYYPAQLNEFNRFPLPAFVDDNPTVVWLSTFGTLAVELALGTLVFWKPARKWVLLLGLLLHSYIEYRFNIPLFSFIICSTYVCFYEGSEVEGWVNRLMSSWRKVPAA